MKKFITFFALSIFLRVSSGEKVIINTDGGADDAIALLVLLRYEANKPPTSTFEIVAITCTYGNIDENQAASNILKTLTVAGRTDLPVYAGARKALLEPFATDNYFGTDGFGNLVFEQKIIVRLDQSKPAATALVDIVKAHAGNISIITLGPLTNVALAINLDTDFIKHVNKFYVMGGSVHGVGNKRPNVEFNFAADPESNYILFNAVKKCQIVLVPWEATLKSAITKEWRLKKLAKYNSPYVKFANKVEAVSLRTSETSWLRADVVLAAVVIDPSLIKRADMVPVEAVVDGRARGSVLVDYSKISGHVSNTKIVQEIDSAAYMKLLVRYLSCEEISC